MDSAALAQIARPLLSSPHADDAAALLRESVCRVADARRAGVFLWERGSGRFRSAFEDDSAALLPDAETADAAFQEAAPITVPHAAGGIVTVVAMRKNDARIGLLVLDGSRAPLDPSRLTAILLLTEHAATAFHNLSTLAETRGQYAMLSNVLDSITNGILVLDAQQRVTLMNRNATAMLGVDSAAIGQSAVETLPAPLLAVVTELLRELQQQGFCMERRVTLRHPGGPELPLAATLSPLRDAAGSSQGHIVVFRDMTATQELERLRRLDEMKSQIVANVSHELKTPLTSIKAYTEALQDMVEGEQPRQFLRVIEEESDRLLFLINDLLNISRIQSGRMKLHLEMSDPAALLPDVLRLSRVQSARHQIITEIEPALPQTMLDRDKMKEVLINLISNAIKYSPKGGRVWIRMKKMEGNIRIEIQDEGMGISKESQAHLFEAFYRVDNSLTYEVAGTGLGLAIVKAIVEHHSGRVWVDSEPSKGSTFFVLIPIRTEARREEEPSLAG